MTDLHENAVNSLPVFCFGDRHGFWFSIIHGALGLEMWYNFKAYKVRRVKMSEEIRLNKYLGEMGVCSRREAARLIEAGKVTVDGVTASMGMKVRPCLLYTSPAMWSRCKRRTG